MWSKAQLLKTRRNIHLASASLDDEAALETPELFPSWEAGRTCLAGERLRFGGELYRVLQNHTAQADWTPDAAPSLYVRVAEPGTIPVWKQPTGAQDAYNAGDKVYFPDRDGKIYESLIDNNVWSPESYPAGWKEI